MKPVAILFYLFSSMVFINFLIQLVYFIKHRKPLSFFVSLWMMANVYYYFYHGLYWEGVLPDYDYLYGSLIVCGCVMLFFIYHTFYFLLTPGETLNSVNLWYILPSAIITVFIYIFSFPESSDRKKKIIHSMNIFFPEYLHNYYLIIFEYIYLGLFFLMLVILFVQRIKWKLVWENLYKKGFVRDIGIVLMFIIVSYMGIWTVIFGLGWSAYRNQNLMVILYLLVVHEFFFGILFVQLIPLLVKFGVLKFSIDGLKPEKYLTSILDGVNIEELKSRFDTLMLEQKIFLDETLNLKKFASAIGFHSRIVSRYCNEKLSRRFDEVVAEHRIKEAIHLIKNSPDKNMLHIGLESGFTSVSSFYFHFKNQTGLSPENFKKQMH